MPSHHKNSSAPGGSQRQLRVGEIVRHAIAEILSQGSVHDPDLEGHIITVPEVRMSPDLKLATIYVMPLGGRDTGKVIAALERNKKFLLPHRRAIRRSGTNREITANTCGAKRPRGGFARFGRET
jgi:ribosome-binding factor A